MKISAKIAVVVILGTITIEGHGSRIYQRPPWSPYRRDDYQLGNLGRNGPHGRYGPYGKKGPLHKLHNHRHYYEEVRRQWYDSEESSESDSDSDSDSYESYDSYEERDYDDYGRRPCWGWRCPPRRQYRPWNQRHSSKPTRPDPATSTRKWYSTHPARPSLSKGHNRKPQLSNSDSEESLEDMTTVNPVVNSATNPPRGKTLPSTTSRPILSSTRGLQSIITVNPLIRQDITEEFYVTRPEMSENATREKKPAIAEEQLKVVISPVINSATYLSWPESPNESAIAECVENCKATSEFHPVCGTDGVTYDNYRKLVCAKSCGIKVELKSLSRCFSLTSFPDFYEEEEIEDEYRDQNNNSDDNNQSSSNDKKSTRISNGSDSNRSNYSNNNSQVSGHDINNSSKTISGNNNESRIKSIDNIQNKNNGSKSGTNDGQVSDNNSGTTPNITKELLQEITSNRPMLNLKNVEKYQNVHVNLHKEKVTPASDQIPITFTEIQVPTTQKLNTEPATTSEPNPFAENQIKSITMSATTSTISSTSESPDESAIAECIESCIPTSEVHPVCGTNGETYDNHGKLFCAKNCGIDVELKSVSRCAPINLYPDDYYDEGEKIEDEYKDQDDTIEDEYNDQDKSIEDEYKDLGNDSDFNKQSSNNDNKSTRISNGSDSNRSNFSNDSSQVSGHDINNSSSNISSDNNASRINSIDNIQSKNNSSESGTNDSQISGNNSGTTANISDELVQEITSNTPILNLKKVEKDLNILLNLHKEKLTPVSDQIPITFAEIQVPTTQKLNSEQTSTSEPNPFSENQIKSITMSATTLTISSTSESPDESAIAECIESCIPTSEVHPVCGTNGETYDNYGKLFCAKNCGVDVELKSVSRCTPINHFPDDYYDEGEKIEDEYKDQDDTIEDEYKDQDKSIEDEYKDQDGSIEDEYKDQGNDSDDSKHSENNANNSTNISNGSGINNSESGRVGNNSNKVSDNNVNTNREYNGININHDNVVLTTVTLPPTRTTARLRRTTYLNSLHRCMQMCPIKTTYNLICGTDLVTYINIDRMECARSCGKDVQILCNYPCSMCNLGGRVLLSKSDLFSATTPLSTISTRKITYMAGRNEENPFKDQCITSCAFNNDYNPVCGNNNKTYRNAVHLLCAQMCGSDVGGMHFGSCLQDNLTTLVTQTVGPTTTTTASPTTTTTTSPTTTTTASPTTTTTASPTTTTTASPTTTTTASPTTTTTASPTTTSTTTAIESKVTEAPYTNSEDPNTLEPFEEEILPREVIQCIRTCPITAEYNPVCGTNDVSYVNLGRLECAQYCTINVEFHYKGLCKGFFFNSGGRATQSLDILRPTQLSTIRPVPTTPITPRQSN